MRPISVKTLHLIALGLACSVTTTSSQSIYETHAEAALQTLQTYYVNSTGLWTSFNFSWWQSGNALTTLANMVSLKNSYAESVADFVFPNTRVNAEKFDANHGYHVKRSHATAQNTASSAAASPVPFSDGFYDDEGWWAIGWIRVYDVTQDEAYLNISVGLFEDMTTGWGTNCSKQGLWWDKRHSEINSIGNSIFLATAAYLANRVPSQKDYYIGWAEKEYNWMVSSGMYSSDLGLALGDINIQTCQLNLHQPSTYVQGNMIAGLTELAEATGQSSYLDTAKFIASSTIHNMTVDGILTEPHIDQANPGPDAPQYKGVFMRALMRLYQSSANSTLAEYAATQAQSIWTNDRHSTAQLGPDWSVYYGPPEASAQSSAMDALVAAWAMNSS